MSVVEHLQPNVAVVDGDPELDIAVPMAHGVGDELAGHEQDGVARVSAAVGQHIGDEAT
jgi:hypothetical protein